MINQLSVPMLLAIATGGALGAVSRFLTQHLMTGWLGLNFPWGTLMANVSGCFVIGIISGFWTSHDYHMSMEIRGFLVIGFLGAFTTFSAFSLDSLVLFQNGDHLKAVLNLVSSVLLCILAVYLGNAITSR